jgi:RNA exonuclease 4
MFNKLGFVASAPATTSNGGKNIESSMQEGDDSVESGTEGDAPMSAPPDECKEPPALVSTKKSDGPRRKRSRRRRKGKSRTKVEPISQKEKQQQQQQLKDQRQKQQHQHAGSTSKKQHDAPMTKRDLYFALKCEMVGIARTSEDVESQSSAVGRVTVVNWENQVVLDTFVQVPVPVSDFRTSTSGIVPADVYSSQAMSFAQVRATVERIITGKILIGHYVEANLAALGLSHPWCDVRDTASFAPFLVEAEDPVSGQRVLQPRTLTDLASTILKRELPEPRVRTRPLDDCIACLDLYKAYRCEWEQDLVKRAQQNDVQQQFRESHAANNLQRHSNVYGQNFPPSPNHGYQHLPLQSSQQHHQALRPRVPSYEVLPPNVMQPLHSPPSYARGGGLPQHQIIPAYETHTSGSIQGSQSSWFRRSRKPRYVPLSSSQHQLQNHAVVSTALSAQAIEVLSGQDVAPHTPYEHEHQASSWSYDGSTLLDTSTDYESSTLYEESVASGSIAFYQLDDAQRAIELEEETCSASGIVMEQQQSSEASSWFRFGSKRSSRLSQQQRQQAQSHSRQSLGVLQELVEEQQHQHPVEGLTHAAYIGSAGDSLQGNGVRQTVSQGKTGVPNYEPPKYFAIIDRPVTPSEKPASSGSGWFGFRRSKSPRTEEEKEREGLSDGDEEKHEQAISPTANLFSEMAGEFPVELIQSSKEESSSAPDSPPSYLQQSFISTGQDHINTIAPLSFFSYNEQSTEDTLLEDNLAQQEEAIGKPASSWFSFRRSRSPSSKDSRRGHVSRLQSVGIDDILLEERAMGVDTTVATEEDWLREVMCEPAEGLHETSVETLLTVPKSNTPSPAEHDGSFMKSDTMSENLDGKLEGITVDKNRGNQDEIAMTATAERKEGPRYDHGGERHNSSNWFRFLRKGTASASRQVSRLEFGATVPAGKSPSITSNEDTEKDVDTPMQVENQKLVGFESFASTQPTASSSFEEEEDESKTNNSELDLPFKVESMRENMARRASEDWLEEVVSPSSCLDSGWFGFPEDPRSLSQFTSAESSPMSTRSTTNLTEETRTTTPGPDGGVAGLKNFDTFLRGRLCTDSTLPTVASEEEDVQELVQGMEKNFSFLNI